MLSAYTDREKVPIKIGVIVGTIYVIFILTTGFDDLEKNKIECDFGCVQKEIILKGYYKEYE